jgi:FkbM family methyltransferase
MNHCSNVKVVPVALADRTGTGAFQKNPDYVSSTGKLASSGDLKVAVDSIDDMIARGELLPPDVIKMDIEGGEYLALRGAGKTLAESHPLIFLATHGPDVHAQCCEFLNELGYRLQALPGKHGKTLDDTDEIVAY